jgi:hypothetical protein
MMRKRVLFGTLAVLTTFGVGRALLAPGTARAQNVERAATAMSTTEERIATQVGKSAASAKAVEQELATPDQLPQELTEFGRTTGRLRQLSQDLANDIGAYETAHAATMAEFDQQLQAIKDQGTRRHMDRLRTRAQRQATEQIQAARSALDTLQTVLAQGADLQHAARCVQLADELRVHADELATQVATAKDQATAYARLSTTLLAKLTRPTADSE